MSEYNERNWNDALIKLYDKSVQDPDFRALCMSDPRAAISQVSDIDLPPKLNLRFFDNRVDFIYSFLLPPVATSDMNTEDLAAEMVKWASLCTVPTTPDA